MIQHYTFFTNTHKIFLKYFLNTYPFDPDIDLIVRYFPQECVTGNFETEGWNKTMSKKVKLILDGFKSDNEIFIHSDADIIFFSPFKQELLKEMDDADIIFQSDVGTPCMGFFACRINKNTQQLFEDVYKNMHMYAHDQEAVLKLIQTNNYKLNIKLFSNKFWNFGMYGRHYRGEDNTLLPNNLIMLHANFVNNIPDKIKLIKTALKQYNL